MSSLKSWSKSPPEPIRHRVVVFAHDTCIALKRTGEWAVYSIPDYALRFAAHCRSRLKYLEAGAHDAARGAAVAGSARFWIRFAAHGARSNLEHQCVTHRARSAA